MPAASVFLSPERDGWSIRLTNGVELARYRGLAARWRAQRYLAAMTAY